MKPPSAFTPTSYAGITKYPRCDKRTLNFDILETDASVIDTAASVGNLGGIAQNCLSTIANELRKLKGITCPGDIVVILRRLSTPFVAGSGPIETGAGRSDSICQTPTRPAAKQRPARNSARRNAKEKSGKATNCNSHS